MSEVCPKVIYEGIDISYVEASNRWRFELRGRERSAESLSKAKEVIDKPEPGEKKPFTRMKAFLIRYDGIHLVEVTSIAENDGSRSLYLWVMEGQTRRKESASSLCVDSSSNRGKLDEMKKLRKEIAEKEKAASAILASLDRITVQP